MFCPVLGVNCFLLVRDCWRETYEGVAVGPFVASRMSHIFEVVVNLASVNTRIESQE